MLILERSSILGFCKVSNSVYISLVTSSLKKIIELKP